MKRKYVVTLAVVFFLVIIWYLNATPGCIPVVDNSNNSKPNEFKTPIEVFRVEWDADTNFDWPITLPMAEISKATYGDLSEVKPVFAKYGLDEVRAITTATNTAYLGFKANDVAVLAFRGTNEGRDWLVNLNVLSHETRNGAVHRGFWNSYDSMKADIENEIRNANPKYLWITGHSLGGALAVVCAYDETVNRVRDVKGVITFGQPKAVGPSLALFLNGKLVGRHAHLVNGSDPVPRVPPGFAHFGRLVWFRGDSVALSEPHRIPPGLAPAEQAELNAQILSREPDLNAELSEMDHEQFEDFKQSLAPAVLSNSEAIPEGADALPQGMTFGAGDHAMDLYIEKIRRVVGPAFDAKEKQ